MPRWNVGDEVVVRHDLATTAEYNVDSDGDMESYIGGIVTIENAFTRYDGRTAYVIREDEQWIWGDSDFRPLLEVGDRVVIRHDLDTEDLGHITYPMLKYRGREATVVDLTSDSNFVRIDIDDGYWNWNVTDFVTPEEALTRPVVNNLAMASIFQHFKVKY